jgi:HPt (histidine-containing phosphotransfer) domain-containing protein
MLGNDDELGAPTHAPFRDRTMSDWQGAPIIDDSVVASLFELGGSDDPGLFRELVGLFQADTPRLLGNMQSSLDIHDIQGLERAAHTLKSSSANMGALRLSRLCLEIESLARGGELSLLPQLVAQAHGLYEEVQALLSSKAHAA